MPAKTQFSSPPYKRSNLRRQLGKTFFTWRRRFAWLLYKRSFACTRQAAPLPHTVFSHRTPLLRQLRDLEMWLQHNKVTNLKLAVARMEGIILRPGQTFSFWRLVGRPTAKKGYLPGMVLSGGSFCPQTGGGLCQLSNLIYWMTLHTPLTVTERWRHNFDIFPDADRTQPFGSGATVAYNYIDLQIKNNTDTPYQLHVSVDDTHLHGQWRAEKTADCKYLVYESSHRISHEWWGGYMRHNILRRKVLDGEGRQINDEHIVENHAVMTYEPLLADSRTP